MSASTALVLFAPSVEVATQHCSVAQAVVGSGILKDPAQRVPVGTIVATACRAIAPWLQLIEQLIKLPAGVNLCFDMRKASFAVINLSPGTEYPDDLNIPLNLCKLIHGARRLTIAPAPASVPAPVIAQSSPVLAIEEKKDEPAVVAPKSKPRPKPTKAFKSKAIVDTDDDEDMQIDEPIIAAEGIAAPNASSSAVSTDVPKKPEVIMIEYDDVPGMDSAAAAKANQKVKGGSGGKKARTDTIVSTPSQGSSPSAAAIERAILKLEEEHADLDFRVAYATQHLDLVNLELERQRKKLAELTGASAGGKGKGKARG